MRDARPPPPPPPPPGEGRPAGRSQSRLGAGAIVGGVAETAGVAPFWIPRGSDLGRREEFACRSHPSKPRPQDQIDFATEGRTLRERRRSEERRVGKECRSRWSP